MNDIEWLEAEIKKMFPNVEAESDYPGNLGGIHYLDIKKANNRFTLVAWNPTQGFGFFAEDQAYTEGPKKIIPEKEKALEHLSLVLRG